MMTDNTERPRAYNPPTVWPVPEGFAAIYSHAVEAQGFLFISGQIGLDAENRLSLDFAEQCEQAFSNVEALLEAAEAAVESIVKVTYYVTRTDDLPLLAEVRRRRWSSERPPAVSTLVVAALVHPQVLIEIDVVAVKDG
jgi:2-iminobutanoate/2-iminopropanoate deaminase